MPRCALVAIRARGGAVTYKFARLECYEGRTLYLIISADRLTALHASEGELSIERMRRARTAR